ncbi:MAG: hypothetical protein IPP13_28200, partial [Kouleothrix sp.]|nr:hypothetical protein [Kouleothrix sp.]
NTAATTGEENEATATRPECACDDTRHETKPHEPARTADQTMEENDGDDETMVNLPQQ